MQSFVIYFWYLCIILVPNSATVALGAAHLVSYTTVNVYDRLPSQRSFANITLDAKPNTVDKADYAFEIMGGSAAFVKDDNMKAIGSWMKSTEGLIGWGLKNSNLKAVVYWYVPFGPRLYGSPNKLGVGFVRSKSKYYLKTLATSSCGLKCKGLEIEEYQTGGVAPFQCHEQLCIRGTMGISTESEISITIYRKGAN